MEVSFDSVYIENINDYVFNEDSEIINKTSKDAVKFFLDNEKYSINCMVDDESISVNFFEADSSDLALTFDIKNMFELSYENISLDGEPIKNLETFKKFFLDEIEKINKIIGGLNGA